VVYLEDDFAGIYKEVAKTMGDKAAIEIHKLFSGQQIAFPKRLYNKDYICNFIKKNYDGSNLRQLSKKFDYSDRRIRQILNQKKQ